MAQGIPCQIYSHPIANRKSHTTLSGRGLVVAGRVEVTGVSGDPLISHPIGERTHTFNGSNKIKISLLVCSTQSGTESVTLVNRLALSPWPSIWRRWTSQEELRKSKSREFKPRAESSNLATHRPKRVSGVLRTERLSC